MGITPEQHELLKDISDVVHLLGTVPKPTDQECISSDESIIRKVRTYQVMLEHLEDQLEAAKEMGLSNHPYILGLRENNSF